MSYLFNVPDGELEYDIETFPNFFSFYAIHHGSEQSWYFELSPWRNDLELLFQFIDECAANGNAWIGYNNLGFDYPVIHFMYKARNCMLSIDDIYKRAMEIINTPFTRRFDNVVWDNDQIIPQIDLFKIHHFDNVAKSTSLKVLEFNMRSESVEDLPFDVGTIVNYEQSQVLKSYNKHDVRQTKKFAKHSNSAVITRYKLAETLGRRVINSSDVKIGEMLLIRALEDHGVQCYTQIDGRKKKLQTQREVIDLGEVIFPYVTLGNPEFLRVAREISERKIYNEDTKGVFDNLVANVAGLEYKFGTGGLHASVSSRIVQSSTTHQLVDVDAASYYPNLAIKNKLFPAHLGEKFCEAYEGLYQTRKTFAKGTPENEAYKLALNGAYGMSNNDYSPLKDSQFTMSITINGQLLLVMLIEQLIKIPGLQMVQANTDGVTYLCPREYLEHSRDVAKWWMARTQLVLEEALYSRMFVRDVNNYIAEYETGKLKRIGAYAYETAEENPGTRELPWHKDWSFRVVAKAAEAYLVHGTDVREFVENHDDVYDFFGRTKVPRNSMLQHGEKRVSNIVRYYISTEGAKLEKVMPPRGPLGEFCRANSLTDSLFTSVMTEIGPGVWDERIHTKNRSTYGKRVNIIHSGYRVEICNDLRGLVDMIELGLTPIELFPDINYEFYIKEALKLTSLLPE
jgi:hypothetical protein